MDECLKNLEKELLRERIEVVLKDYRDGVILDEAKSKLNKQKIIKAFKDDKVMTILKMVVISILWIGGLAIMCGLLLWLKKVFMTAGDGEVIMFNETVFPFLGVSFSFLLIDCLYIKVFSLVDDMEASVLKSYCRIIRNVGLWAIVLLTIATLAWPYIYHSISMMLVCWLTFLVAGFILIVLWSAISDD